MVVLYRWSYIQILPGNEAWNCARWERKIQDKAGAKAFMEAVFRPFQAPGVALMREGTRALRISTLAAIPPPPPSSNIFPADLPDDLSTAGFHELGTVVLDLAEGNTQLPPGFCPNRRVIVEELLPMLEGLTGIHKCPRCLYPSTRCECGGVQPQDQQMGLPQAPQPAPTSTTPSSTVTCSSTLSQGAVPKTTPPVPTMGASYAGALASPAVQVPPHHPHPVMVWNPVSGWLDMRPTYEHTSSQCLLQIQQALLQSVQAAPGAVSSQPIRHPSPPQPGRTQQTTKKADPPKGGSASASGSTSAPPTKGGSIMRGRGRAPLTSKSDKAEPTASGADNQEWSQSQGHRRHPKPKSSASGEAEAPSSWADDLRVEVQMAEGDQGEETHLISHMDTSEDPPSSEKPLEGPVDVEDSGPSLPKSEGWRVDFTTILKYFMKLHYPGITPTRMRQAIREVLQWLDNRREYWQPVREGDPIAFMKYLAQVVQEQTGLILSTLNRYTKWIKATSWYHAVVLRWEQLNLCPHLARAELPKPNIHSPSEDMMLSHWADYAAAHKRVEEALVTLAKVQQNLHTSITIRKGDHKEIKPLELPVPIQAVPSTSGGGDTSRAPSTGLMGNKRHKRSALGDPGCPGRSLNPFPLNLDNEERRAMVKILLDTTGGFGYTICEEVAESIHALYPDLDIEAC